MLGAAPTLESNYWFGAQGTRLWIGQVEGDGITDIGGNKLIDKQESNRVKVRIMGYHTRSRKELPPQKLPWATVMIPTTESVSRDSAGSVHGLENGMWVLGMFMDGESAQQPLVMGSIGIVDAGQTYQDRITDLGFSNDYVPKHPDKVLNNKPDSGAHGQSNRGSNTGNKSANDKRQESDERQTFVIANGKCGTRPEQDFTVIFNDLFQFIGKNDKVGSLLIDKTTGNIVKSASLISTYVSRLGAAAIGILGDIKQLILNEFKRYFQEFIIDPVVKALTLKPTKDSTVIWATDKVGEVLLEILKCLFKTVFEKVMNLILDIVTGIIDDFLNTAFCMVADVIKSITSTISDSIGQALGAFKSIASMIGEYGDWGGSWVKKIGELIALFCDGQLSCILGTGTFTTKEGETPDNSVEAFFNRTETFGNLPGDLEVGLFGSDSFLSTFENTQIVGGDGKVAKGTLNCSKSNSFAFPAIPNIFFTGLKNKFDEFLGDFPGPFPSFSGPVPRAIPAINSNGVIVGAVVTHPGYNLPDEPKASVIPYRGQGGNAVLTPVVEDGKLKDLIVNNGGGGYPFFDGAVSNADNVPTLPNGDPDYTKIYGVYVENPYWLGVITPENEPVVINAGFGLDQSCGIIVEPGDDEVNEVVLPELKVNIVNGRLIGIQVIKEGFGFTTLPKMYVSCGSTDIAIGNQRVAKIIPRVKYIPRKDASEYLKLYDQYQTIIDCVGHPGE